eukprot:scaffold5679_cov23-Prasinocladus_malaysianus.AAC.1
MCLLGQRAFVRGYLRYLLFLQCNSRVGWLSTSETMVPRLSYSPTTFMFVHSGPTNETLSWQPCRMTFVRITPSSLTLYLHGT